MYYVVFRRSRDLEEDEALDVYMAALSVLFQNMERDLGYGTILSCENEK
jgi:hypothetical protein